MIDRPADNCDLRPRRTRAVEIFRTTPPDTVCPNFYVLAHANGCGFEPHCSYCYLKSSLWHSSRRQAFSNTEELLAEVAAWIDRDGLEATVLNSGNLSDSLTFEAVRPLMGELIELFRARAEQRHRPHCLLIVTKGAREECRPLEAAEPCANIIVSFSINAPEAAREFEPGAPPPAERLAAAGRLLRAGWRVRLRFDPMIAGYDYAGVLAEAGRLRPERVTLGTLRAEANLERFAPPGLFDRLAQRQEARELRRYPFSERLEIYRPAAAAMARICPVGLCEETPEMWAALGLDAQTPKCNCGS